MSTTDKITISTQGKDPWGGTTASDYLARKSNIISEGTGLDLQHALREAENYFRKPRREFLQLDGWADYPAGDFIMVPDDDGDRQISGTTVRVLIDPTTPPAVVLRVLGKLTAWYQREHESLLNPPSPFE